MTLHENYIGKLTLMLRNKKHEHEVIPNTNQRYRMYVVLLTKNMTQVTDKCFGDMLSLVKINGIMTSAEDQEVLAKKKKNSCICYRWIFQEDNDPNKQKWLKGGHFLRFKPMVNPVILQGLKMEEGLRSC